MVKPIAAFSGNLLKNRILGGANCIFAKLTESLEQSTVRIEQVILPYSPDLLKLSRYLWSSHPLANDQRRPLCFMKLRHSTQNPAPGLNYQKTTAKNKSHRNTNYTKMKKRRKAMKIDNSTRSSKVFAAGSTIDNRFLLCRVAAVYARRLQKTRIQFAESINQSLRLISDLPRGHMDTTNLPPVPAEEIPVLEPVAAAISL
jgi:hypothetical protein